MMHFIFGCIAGGIVGSVIGFGVACLCRTAKRADEAIYNKEEEWHEYD